MKKSFFAFVLLMFCIALTSQSQATTEPEVPQPVEPATKEITFNHPISTDAAAQILTDVGLVPKTIIHGESFLGIHTYDQQTLPSANMFELENEVAGIMGVTATIFGLEVDPSFEGVDDVVAIAADFPEVHEVAVPSPTVSNTITKTPRTVYNLNTYDVASSPAWAPSTVKGKASVLNGDAVFTITMDWLYVNHSPLLAPDDWGFEFDWSLLNPALSGDRPSCITSNDSQFWASRINEGLNIFIQIDGVKADKTKIGFYVDGNDLFDKCSRLGFAFGIAYPDQLPIHPTIRATIIADKGFASFSNYFAASQMTTNDCLVVDPQSNCMGLNTRATFPGPGVSNYYHVKGLHQYATAGCFTYRSSNQLKPQCL